MPSIRTTQCKAAYVVYTVGLEYQLDGTMQHTSAKVTTAAEQLLLYSDIISVTMSRELVRHSRKPDRKLPDECRMLCNPRAFREAAQVER